MISTFHWASAKCVLQDATLLTRHRRSVRYAKRASLALIPWQPRSRLAAPAALASTRLLQAHQSVLSALQGVLVHPTALQSTSHVTVVVLIRTRDRSVVDSALVVDMDPKKELPSARAVRKGNIITVQAQLACLSA